LILESGGERRELKVTGTITIGRSAQATVQVDDKTLSREHTQVYLQNGRLYVRDLESKNGTYLNGVLLKQAEPLKHGDRIKVGPAIFSVVLEAGDVMPAVQAAIPARPAAPVAHAAPPTSRAVAPPPRSRPEPAGDYGTSDFMILVYRGLLIGVVVVGAFITKPIFAALLDRIPK
jgi:predicted component of type VI protein secretion system